MPAFLGDDMLNKFRIVFLILPLLILTACPRKISGENAKTELEFSFGNNVTETDLSLLETLIGTGSGNSETFGEKADILLYFGDRECGTCSRVLPVIEDWISLSKCKVYAYYEDPSADKNEKSRFLKKLGSSDGQELTAGRLIAFVGGRRMASVSGVFDLETPEKISSFAARYFSLLPPEKIKVHAASEIKSLEELAKISSGKESSLIYFERRTCPDCRILGNPNKSSSLKMILTGFDFDFHKITTEDILYQMNKEVQVGGKKYGSAFDYFSDGTENCFWSEDESEKKKTETVEMILALGLADFSLQDISCENILESVKRYILSEEKKFMPESRNVPSFVFTGSMKNFSEKEKLLDKFYELSGQKKEGDDYCRSKIVNYFSIDNTCVKIEVYQEMLKQWLKLM